MYTFRRAQYQKVSNLFKSTLLNNQRVRSLFIQTQQTPNENALKFIPSSINILPSQTTPTIEITSVKDALHKSELAFKLFSINDLTGQYQRGIKSVLLGYDFITVEKYSNDSNSWKLIKPEIFAILTEFLTSGQQILNLNHPEMQKLLNKDQYDEDELYEEEEDEVIALINELLVTRIQPAIQEDGGDIKFVRFDEDTGTVYLKLIGACRSCSSSTITLKNGIEGMLKYYIDEVKHVEQILDEDQIQQQQHQQQSEHQHSPDFDMPPSL